MSIVKLLEKMIGAVVIITYIISQKSKKVLAESKIWAGTELFSFNPNIGHGPLQSRPF